jgi:flagellar hook-associated protein 2
MQLEEIPKNKLIEKRTAIESRKKIFSELDSKLSALKSKSDYLTDIITDRFAAKKTTVSDSDLFGITAKGNATKGVHSISVQQLAKADTRVSNKFDDSASDFSAFLTDQTFTIEVAHPTDEDANNRVSIEVTVTAAQLSGTNDDVLQNISGAINLAMSEAFADETIDNDEVVNASVVKEETGTSRLVLTSAQTGYGYRMDFGSSSLLDTLNVNNNALSVGDSGGYKYAVGSSMESSALSSQFTMDGLNFYRNSNTVSDALTGTTIRLKDLFSTEETFTIATDVETVKKDVQAFIDAYNEAIVFIRDQTKAKSDSAERGVLASDFVYSNIKNDLRRLVSSEVSTASNQDYTLLYDIGIETNQDGKLSIADADKFEEALEANSQYVSDLFRSEDGVAQKVYDYVNNFVKTGGTIDGTTKAITQEVSNVSDRIKYMDEMLVRKEKQYFNEFSKLQETMYLLQNQQTFYSTFLTSKTARYY